MKRQVGEFELNTPHYRAGSFEPQIIKKHQTQLTEESERKIIALFVRGNSYQDIRSHIAEIYGMSLFNGTLNAITDKLIPELEVRRERDLETIYSIAWLDVTHYKYQGAWALRHPSARPSIPCWA